MSKSLNANVQKNKKTKRARRRQRRQGEMGEVIRGEDIGLSGRVPRAQGVPRIKLPIARQIKPPVRKFQKKVATSTNMRLEKDASSNNVIATLATATALTLSSSLKAISGVAAGIVSYALQRGFATEIISAQTPYLAYVYLTGILQGAMEDSVPKVHQVPKWFKRICDGLIPIRHPIANGWFGLNWNVNFDYAATPWLYDMGPTGTPRNWNIGVIQTAPIVNGVFHTIAIPPAYTEDAGAAAWTSLLNFFKTIGAPMGEQSMVEFNGPTLRYNDQSCFATPVRIFGNSGSNEGGFFNVRTLETPIYTPSSSVFAAIQLSAIDEPQRAPMYQVASSGDAVFYGANAACTLSPFLFKSQIAPVFKPVDFNEFVEVIALFAARVAGVAAADALNAPALLINPNAFSLGMTLQELEVMLRNVMMNAFSDTQFSVQGIYPSESFNNNNPFLPFISGVGTYPVPVNGMKLPQLFVENMRSLTYRIQKNVNPISFFPVLGIKANDRLVWSDFTYLIPGDEVPHHIFIDPTLSNEIPEGVGKKSLAELKRLSAEVVISLVDGSTGTDYIAINGPFALETFTNNWNQWYELITPFVQGKSVTIGKDAGIFGLAVVSVTDLHFENQQGHPSMPPGHNAAPKNRLPKRLKTSYDANTTSFYNTRMVGATTSFEPLLANPWDTIQATWIHPMIEFMFTGPPNNIVTLAKWQSITHELLSLTYTAGDDQFTLFQKHVEYASAMVRSRNGSDSMATILLAEMELEGRGGILSSVIGLVADALLKPRGASVPAK